MALSWERPSPSFALLRSQILHDTFGIRHAGSRSKSHFPPEQGGGKGNEIARGRDRRPHERQWRAERRTHKFKSLVSKKVGETLQATVWGSERLKKASWECCESCSRHANVESLCCNTASVHWATLEAPEQRCPIQCLRNVLITFVLVIVMT